jgi:hypothetical protein
MTPKKQVSPAIRILRGERDASARATHLEAATRKFLVTTNERKQMSTKTNFKRIALVAVAALGLGVLSSVPSQAVGNLAVTITNGSFVAGKSDSTTAATIAISATLEDIKDTITVAVVGNGTLGDSVVASSDRVARLIYLDTTTAARSLVGETLTAGLLTLPTNVTNSKLDSRTVTAGGLYTLSAASLGNVGARFGIQVDSVSSAIVAGTYSFTVFVKQYTQGVTQPVTTSYTASLTAAVDTTATTPSAVTSFVNLKAAGTAAGTASAADVAVNALATAGTTAGYLFVGNRNAANGSSTAQDSITASISGAGQVCTTTGFGTPVIGTCGQNIKVSAIGDVQFAVQGNGTSGVGTITVSSSVAGWSYTKSASFYLSTAKTITATVGHPLLRVGTNDGAVRATAVDASGTDFRGSLWIVASSAADALIAGSTTPVSCGSFNTTDLRYNCPVDAIAVGTAKFKVIDASTVAAATATSTEVTVTVTAAIPASVRLSFDKATYAPNERARIYVTPLDAAGKEMQRVTGDLLASPGISVNGSVSFVGSTTTADSLTATSITTSASSSSTTGARAGSMVYTVYMPAAGGTVTLTATGGTGLPVAARTLNAITATATVTDSGAAALAAVTALATTVASLKTLITTLTNLVLKIQKKVKA